MEVLECFAQKQPLGVTEISEKLSRSSEDIAAGRISAQCDMDAQVKKLLQSRAAKI